MVKNPIGLFFFTNLTNLTDLTNLHLTDLYDNLVDQIIFKSGAKSGLPARVSFRSAMLRETYW